MYYINIFHKTRYRIEIARRIINCSKEWFYALAREITVNTIEWITRNSPHTQHTHTHTQEEKNIRRRRKNENDRLPVVRCNDKQQCRRRRRRRWPTQITNENMESHTIANAVPRANSFVNFRLFFISFYFAYVESLDSRRSKINIYSNLTRLYETYTCGHR